MSMRSAALLLLLPAVVPAQTAPVAERVQQRVQGYLDSLHAGARFPGAQVAVVLPQGQAVSVAVGWADSARKERMTTSHRLLQGSVGKTYASAVALQLVHEGRIGVDDPVSRYLGDAPWFARLPNAQQITVRMLMNHTSGLVRYEFKEQFTRDLTADPDRVWKPEDLVAYILDTEAPFAAGQGWEYSDTNYIVLGMIIEKVTGRRFYDLARERLLQPLQLGNTVPSEGRVIQGLSQGYAGPNNPFGGTDAMIVGGRFAINPQFEWTGGGMASTAEDLARWGKALYEGRAFDAALLPRLLEAVPARLGPNTRYGLGVIIRETPLGTTHGHSGFFPGYQAELMYLPAAKVAIAFQVNSSAPGALGRSPTRVALDVAQRVVEELNRPE
ncbi:MAG TPA: serine hydrolase domain-containing protein [Gemmatimonadaceae bacterium]|nr:serine hydrolase domain-containing protein [Gemmatimonadaceae bacterium]